MYKRGGSRRVDHRWVGQRKPGSLTALGQEKPTLNQPARPRETVKFASLSDEVESTAGESIRLAAVGGLGGELNLISVTLSAPNIEFVIR